MYEYMYMRNNMIGCEQVASQHEALVYLNLY